MTADRFVPALDGAASDAMLKLRRFFTKCDQTEDGRAVFGEGGRRGDIFHRDRWSHDKLVRSTHGVDYTSYRLVHASAVGARDRVTRNP